MSNLKDAIDREVLLHIKEITERMEARVKDKALIEKCTPILEPSEEVKNAVKTHLDFNKTFLDTITPEKKEQ